MAQAACPPATRQPATGAPRSLLATGKASLSIPCFAERRYGGVLDDELLMACPPADLPKAIAGMQALAKNGLRYPIPQYGIQSDARLGLGASYPAKSG